jgi:hypothetical protein
MTKMYAADADFSALRQHRRGPDLFQLKRLGLVLTLGVAYALIAISVVAVLMPAPTLEARNVRAHDLLNSLGVSAADAVLIR